MGCDIHLYVERRNEADDCWLTCDKWSQSEFTDAAESMRLGVWYADAFFHKRNYELFAMLAGVRNGDGREVEPISRPRGFPDYLNPLVEDELRRQADHSYSWLLLSELQAVDWDGKTLKCSGCVPLKAYYKWKAEQSVGPHYYCQGVNGGLVKVFQSEREWLSLADAQQERIIASEPEHQLHNNTYIYCEWVETWRHAAGKDWFNALDRMAKLHEDPTKVRIVFGFDS